MIAFNRLPRAEGKAIEKAEPEHYKLTISPKFAWKGT